MKFLPKILSGLVALLALSLSNGLLVTSLSPAFAQNNFPSLGISEEAQYFANIERKKAFIPESLQEKFLGEESGLGTPSYEGFAKDTQFFQAIFVPNVNYEPKEEASFYLLKIVGNIAKPVDESGKFDIFRLGKNITYFFSFIRNLLSPPVGELGLLQTVKLAANPLVLPQTLANATAGAGVLKEGVADFKRATVPEGVVVRAGSGITSQVINIGDIPNDLMSVFRKASQGMCVPLPTLLAVGEIEGESMFGFTSEEIKQFSTPTWWVGASQEELKRGHCTNSCEPNPQSLCPALTGAGADVRGVMQFAIETWQGYVPQIKEVLQREFGVSGNYQPERCNLRDVLIGAAIKMKANSGTSQTQCIAWPEDVVRNVASYYYGGKPSPNGCITTGGWNYCDRVWDNYQKWSAQP